MDKRKKAYPFLYTTDLVSSSVLVDDGAVMVAVSLHPLHGPVGVLIRVVQCEADSIGKLGLLVHRAI